MNIQNLYQLCKDADTRRGLKVSDIATKGFFNDNNENYLIFIFIKRYRLFRAK